MKTNKLITGIAITSSMLCFNAAKAQGLYGGIGGGYAFAAAKQSFSYDSKQTTGAGGSTTEYTSRATSFGKGATAGLHIGFMFNENLGLELGANYLFGGKNVFTDEQIGTGSNSKAEDEWKASMIRIVPAIRMTTGDGKLKPFMRMGLVLGVGGKLTNDYVSTSTTPGGTNTTMETWEYTGGIGLGFNAGLGVNFMIADNLGIFAELDGNYMNWAPKKGMIVTSTYNEQDMVPFMDTYDKEIEFVDSYTYDSSSPPDPNKPQQMTQMLTPFSSIGINVGIHFALGGD
jgi:hypothetical protein